MNYEKISIVIPTFNRADFLVECIDSCLNQTHQCEIIVCDHGSTDDTPVVAQKYGNKIKYIRRELDSGVHFCWLDGILHATNDLIHINFDDDWIEPTYIEKCIKLFNDNVGCVISNVKLYSENTKEYRNKLFYFDMTTGIYDSNMLAQFNLTSLTSPGCGVFRKEILIDNLFSGKIPFTKNYYHGVGPDILFTLMSCKDFAKFGYINEDLAVFRDHQNSITIDASKDRNKQILINQAYDDARIYFYIIKIFKKIGIYSIVKKILTKKQKK